MKIIEKVCIYMEKLYDLKKVYHLNNKTKYNIELTHYMDKW